MRGDGLGRLLVFAKVARRTELSERGRGGERGQRKETQKTKSNNRSLLLSAFSPPGRRAFACCRARSWAACASWRLFFTTGECAMLGFECVRGVMVTLASSDL